jgi:hypothetical protein
MRATDSAAQPAGTAVQTENAGAPVKLGRFTRHHAHKRHVAHARKSAKAAPKTDEKDEEKTAAQSSDKKKVPLPPTIADANAEMPGNAEDRPRTEADALANSAGEMLSSNQESSGQAETAPSPAAAPEIVSPDELNEIDQALNDEKQTTPTLALASLDAAASASNADSSTPHAAVSEDTTWNRASLIGKIFIAFGGVLTLASAARMFMA